MPAGHNHINAGRCTRVAGSQANSNSAIPSTEPNPISWTIVVGRPSARHNSTPGTVVDANQTPKYATTDVAGSPTVASATTTTVSNSSHPITVAARIRICAMTQSTLCLLYTSDAADDLT